MCTILNCTCLNLFCALYPTIAATPRVHHPTSAAERHLALQPVDRTGTQAYKPSRLAYSSAPGELLAGSLHLVGLSTWATEIAADDARLAGELLPARNLRLDGRQPRLDALTDHRALEFAKCSCDLEEQLASGRGRVEVLLLQIQIHTYCLEMLDGAEKVDQRPPEPIDRPGHHHIETPPTGVVEHRVKPWALISPLGATDAGVSVNLHDLPAAALRDLPELPNLVFDRLAVSAHTCV